MKEIISTTKAPAAIGPYSQAVCVGDMIYTSGMIPINPETGELVLGDITEQAKQAIKNLKELVEASGSSLDRVVKTTVFIKNMDENQNVDQGQNYRGTIMVEILDGGSGGSGNIQGEGY